MPPIVRTNAPKSVVQNLQLKTRVDALEAENAALRTAMSGGPPSSNGKAAAKMIPTADQRIATSKPGKAESYKTYYFDAKTGRPLAFEAPGCRKVELMSMEQMRKLQQQSQATIIQASGRIMAGRVTSTTPAVAGSRTIKHANGSSVTLIGPQKIAPTPAQIDAPNEQTVSHAEEDQDDSDKRFALIELR